MTTSTTTVIVTSANTVSKVNAPWMRAAIYFQALSQGFTHTQKSSNLDTYTKGTKVVEVSWSNVVTGASITLAKGQSPKVLAPGHQGKLQILSKVLGHRDMTVAQKWNASDLFTLDSKGAKVKATSAQLKELAPSLFKAL